MGLTQAQSRFTISVELNTNPRQAACDRDHAHHQTILVPLARAGEQNRASRPTKQAPEAAPLVSESSVQSNAVLVPHTGNTRSRRYVKVEPGTSVASHPSHGCRRDNPSNTLPRVLRSGSNGILTQGGADGC